MLRRGFLLKGGRAALVSCLAASEVWANSIKTPRNRLPGANLIDDLEKLIPELMREAVLPGLSIAVIKNGELLWRQGFGVRDTATNEPVTNDTVFEAASVSKTVFAYAVMKLCDKGLLDLDTPLTEYMPQPFLEGDPRSGLITARHVLSHTSGFQNIRSGDEPLKIHFTPGQEFSYSGEGYFYLQSVMTRLNGKEYPDECGQFEAGLSVCATDIDEYMKRNLLHPFGMNSSTYVWNDATEKQTASPHDVNGKSFPKSKPKASDMARYAAMGGLHTTPSDYARFLLEVINPGSADAFRLSRKNLDEMLRPQIKLREGEKIDDADAWALGWAVQQRKSGNIILHSGGQAGFRSLVMGSVERKSGFVMLTNGDNGGRVIFHPDLLKKLDQLLFT